MDYYQQLKIKEDELRGLLKTWYNIDAPETLTPIGLDTTGTAASALTFIEVQKAGFHPLVGVGVGLLSYFGGKLLTSRNIKEHAYKADELNRQRNQRILALLQQIEKLKHIIAKQEKTERAAKERLREEQLARMQRREANRPKPKENTIISAASYKQLDIPTISFHEGYKELLGTPGENFYKIVTGEPGNGKTTYCVRFAHYFGVNFGPVLYLQAEQAGNNADFKGLMIREDVSAFDIERNPQDYTLDEIIERGKKYKLIIFDSVNYMKLKPEDIRRIRKELPHVAIILVMQYTKEGHFKGSLDYKHDCDIFIDMLEQGAANKKARSAMPTRIPLYDLPLE